MPPPLFDLENVTIHRGTRRVLNWLTLSIAGGQHVAILEPNGSVR